MPGITYFCTDNLGNTYTRYSAGHTQPCYTHARIARRSGTTVPVLKHMVSYASSEALAVKACAVIHPWNMTCHKEQKPWRYTAEVVEVRAYPGKLKAEPSSKREG
jgi:hypothetical protein